MGGGAVLTSLTCTSLIYYVTKLLFVVYIYIAHVVVWLSGGGGIDVHVTCILHYETCLRCTSTLHMLFNGYQGGWGGINVLDVHVTCMLLYETFVR